MINQNSGLARHDESSEGQQEISFMLTGIPTKPLFTPEPTFSLISGGKKFMCHLTNVVIFSPRIRRLVLCDPTIKSVIVPIPGNDELFKRVISLIYGKDILIDDYNYQYLHQIALFFENDELLQATSDFIAANYLYPENAFMTIDRKPITNETSVNEVLANIRCISYNFGLFVNSQELMRLPIHILDQILADKDLDINSEADLFIWLKNLAQQNNMSPEYISLFSHIHFDSLSKQQAEEFLTFVRQEDIAGSLWHSMCERLTARLADHKPRPIPQPQPPHLVNQQQISQPIQQSFQSPGITSSIPQQNVNLQPVQNVQPESLMKRYTADFLDTDPNDGVFAYLDRTEGITNTIETDGGGQKKRFIARILEDGVMNTWWNNFNGSSFSKDEAWLSISFIRYKLSLTGYCLSTSMLYANQWQPKSWIVYGSNDGKNWNILDERHNETSMNVKDACNSYFLTRPAPFYSHFKIVQLENWYKKQGPERFQFCLNHLEFYGTIEYDY